MSNFLAQLGLADPSRSFDVAAATEARVQPNSRPLGTYTGVPPQTFLRPVLVAPLTTAAGAPIPATLVVPATRESRFVTFLAPAVGATVYVGGPGITPGNGFALPAGVAHEIPLPGNQDLYAVTDAPVYVPLRVQIAPALAGDVERRL